MFKIFQQRVGLKKKYHYDKYFKKWTLSRYYLVFAIMFIFLIVIFSSLIGASDYHAYQENQQRELEASALKIETDFNSLFDTIFYMQTFMGKQIAEHGAHDLNYILQLFRNFNEVKNHASILYTWSLYDWLDSSLHVVIASGIGIVKPVDYSDRYYIQKTKQMPWCLCLSHPVKGRITGIPIIGTAMGVTDANGKYLGAILVGVDSGHIIQRITHLIKQDKIHFTIVNEEGKIVLTSNKDVQTLQESFISVMNDKSLNSVCAEGVLSESVKNETVHYSFFRKFSRHPYVLLIGLDQNIIKKELLLLLIPKIFEYVCLGLICLLLLMFFKYWFINPAQAMCAQSIKLLDVNAKFYRPRIKSAEFFHLTKALLYVKRHLQRKQRIQKKLELTGQHLTNMNVLLSNKERSLEEAQNKLQQAICIAKESDDAKAEFSRQLNTDLRVPLNTILESTKWMCEQLLEQENGKNFFLKELKTIYQAAIELKTSTRTDLKFHLVNIKNIIDVSININKKNAFNKKINFNISLQKNLPTIYADKFRLTQAIVSLLHRAISGSPEEGMVYITCSSFNLERQQYIKLQIDDKGFGLSETDFIRIKSSFDSFECTDVMELELETIKQLIELQGGKLSADVIFGEGTKIVIILPISNSKEGKEIGNIYSFNSN